MSARQLSEAGLAALAAALGDLGTVNRWREKVVSVDGSECWWWTGAISGRGHGRFYFAPGRVIISQRFAFGLVHGVQVLDRVRVLGHRCDNPLCQRVHPEHVVASSYAENRREWAARRELSGSPLGDPRGARRRAHELRDLARQDPALVRGGPGAAAGALRGAAETLVTVLWCLERGQQALSGVLQSASTSGTVVERQSG